MGLAIFLFYALNIDAKIVFQARIEHTGDTLSHIYAMEDDGSNLRRITSPQRYDRVPRWFPDGKQIVFERDWGYGKQNTGDTRHREFFIIDETGMNEHSFMDNHRKDTDPVPSPDGQYILFDSYRDNKYLDIYSYDLVRKKLNQLTHNNTIEDGFTQRPTWSPDGNKVVYHNVGDTIWIMDSDGSRKERITPFHQGNTFLNRAYQSWSPSGKYIMYYESEFVNEPLKVITNHIIIQNVWTDTRTIHKFPVEGRFTGLAWMGNDNSVLFAYREQRSDSPRNIYRYELNSRKMTKLTDFPLGHAIFPHWVEGSLAVSPQDKITTCWGHLIQK